MLTVGVLIVGVLVVRAMAASAATMVSAGSMPLAIETIYYLVFWVNSGEVSILWISFPPPYIIEP
jgi:hypothetical protein